jgi:ABC-type transport system substrate-binding protein
VKVFPDISTYFAALPKALPNGIPQTGINGWYADYPAASNFLSLISCSTAGDPSTNLSGFCSPAFDAKLKQASALEAQDRDAATKLWVEVDRDATNLAALVPTYTPRNVDLVSKRVGNYQHHPLVAHEPPLILCSRTRRRPSAPAPAFAPRPRRRGRALA